MHLILFANEDEEAPREDDKKDQKNCLCLCHLRKGEGEDALNDVSKRQNFPKHLNWFIESCFVIAFIVSSSMELIFFNEIIALRVKKIFLKNWLDFRRER